MSPVLCRLRFLNAVVAMLALEAFSFATHQCYAITISLDYTLDEQNENWFDPTSPLGLVRRSVVNAAAGFLSAIITNDDWEPLASLDESITFTDIASPTIKGLSGDTLVGTPESDGQGYSYATATNDIDVTNRSSVDANEYVIYVGAFAFDSGTTANAKASWDSSDRRNSAGDAEIEFNTWGGKIYFNTTKTWYVGSNPGIDPTDNYGVQDSNKAPLTDISTDNWDWSTSSDSWKGFALATIDPVAAGKRDLYATALHEMMHALGATESVIEDYVGVDANGDFVGPHLLEAYGGPVPGDGGHFQENTQSLVWASGDILSETVLDPNSLSGVRKYFTEVDAALLRDLGYQVLNSFAPTVLAGDYNADGSVDAIDYAVWRENLGADVSLPGDHSPGVVSHEDFETWLANFSASGGVAASIQTPEPHTVWIVAIALILSGRLLGRDTGYLSNTHASSIQELELTRC